MQKHRADWLALGSYGIMVHYLVTLSGRSRAEKTADQIVQTCQDLLQQGR